LFGLPLSHHRKTGTAEEYTYSDGKGARISITVSAASDGYGGFWSYTVAPFGRSGPTESKTDLSLNEEDPLHSDAYRSPLGIIPRLKEAWESAHEKMQRKASAPQETPFDTQQALKTLTPMQRKAFDRAYAAFLRREVDEGGERIYSEREAVAMAWRIAMGGSSRRNPRVRRNPLDTGYVPEAPRSLRYGPNATAYINPSPMAYVNPASDKQNAYRRFMAGQKADGVPHREALQAWRVIRAEAKRVEMLRGNIGEVAEIEVYELAEKLFGSSDWLHASGMIWRDRAVPKRKRKTRRITEEEIERDYTNQKARTRIMEIELSPRHGSGSMLGSYNTPAFVRGLKAIRDKYKEMGLLMTIKAPVGRKR